MGKGDKKSRRGKIFAGSYGKTRPKHKKAPSAVAATSATAEEKPKTRSRKKTAE